MIGKDSFIFNSENNKLYVLLKKAFYTLELRYESNLSI
jgi:hypothetical protein